MPNRLAAASSPYLLQHQDNPVDWFEWGEEAFAQAKATDRPILLSVGYSACHWCHVMAHESFEDPATAEVMNRLFVNVKVDREERPDVDRIYMDALQAMTGQGGWPMTVFLDVERRPFYAGTYFPHRPLPGRPAFAQVLAAVSDAWVNHRDDVSEQAARLTSALRTSLPAGREAPPRSSIDAGLQALAATFDHEHGGFGRAPKFPQAPSLELLMRAEAMGLGTGTDVSAATMLRITLDRMHAGGIYDHLGGGFARYAVDRIWLVPHFEKMLYDNALLARIYLRSGQVLAEPRYTEVARHTLDYVLRDLRHPEGGIFSAEDADSEGEEGRFYVWGSAEIAELLGDRAPAFADAYGVTEAGNFDGTNVLHLAASSSEPAGFAAERAVLFEARELRQRPGLDDKVVTAWNGLMLRALAEAAAVLAEPRYLEAAAALADFATTRLRDGTGRLARSWREGKLGPPGYCDDYSALAVGLFALYQAGHEERWFQEGIRLVDEMLTLFPAPEGGFYATGSDAEALIARPMNLIDNPTPSDNTLAAEALQIANALTGDPRFLEALHGSLRAAAPLLDRHPTAAANLVAVMASEPVHEIAVVGSEEDRTALTGVVWAGFRPNCVVAAGDGTSPTAVPLLEGRPPPATGALAYVCRDFACDAPVEDPQALATKIGAVTGRDGRLTVE